MGKRVNPALIGGFVVGAVVLAVVAVTIWGSGRFFERSQMFVCYFPGSVNGLQHGAPVKFRGVQIGEVTEIHLRYQQVRAAPRVPVFLKLDEKRIHELGVAEAPTRQVMEQFIANGMRARLQTLSIVTGVLYVDFDLLPEAPAELVQRYDDPIPEIPTLPTTLEEMTKSVSDVLMDLRAVDFQGIGRRVNDVLHEVKELVGKPELKTAIEGLPPLVARMQHLVTELDGRAGPLFDSARGTADEATRAAQSVRETFDGVRTLIAPDAPLAIELTRTVVDLGSAARALRELADYLERNPNSVVFGRAENGK